MEKTRSCSNITKLTYPGGFLKNKKTIFDKLAEFGIHVPKDEQFFPYFICYDFEAILEKVQIQSSEKLVWTQRHVPVSVSISSNVANFKDKQCFVSADIDKLLKDMVEYMKKISKTVEKLTKKKWSEAIKKLKQLIKEYGGGKDNSEQNIDTMSDDEDDDEGNDELDSDDERFIDDRVVGNDVMYNDLDEVFEQRAKEDRERRQDRENTKKDDPHRYIRKKVTNLYGQFMRYCSQVPVLSFNGGR